MARELDEQQQLRDFAAANVDQANMTEAEKEHIVTCVLRTSMMQRMRKWISFMEQPAFAEISLSQAKTRMDRGNSLWEQTEKMHMESVRVATLARAPTDRYGDEFEELEEQFLHGSARLYERFVELTHEHEQQGAAAPVGPAQANDNQQPLVLRMTPQQHNIPNTWGHFDGNSLLKWKDFQQRFTAAIHTNADVSIAYKFSYLKNSLKGKAAESIAGYEVSEANYNAAWERLNKDYDRKYPLARSYLTQFFQLKMVSEPATAEELRKLSNVTMETIRNMQNLGIQTEQWNMIIVHVLHGLLNSKLSFDWNMELKDQHNDVPTIEHMIEFIDKRASAATDTAQTNVTRTVQNEHAHRPANRNSSNASSRIEHAHRPAERSNSNASSRNSSAARSQAGSARGSALGATSGQPEKWRYPCGACGGNHKIYYCPDFKALSYNGRTMAARKHGLCVLCLKRGHSVDDCFDLARCGQSKCRGNSKHNSMLCPNREDQQAAHPAQVEEPRGRPKTKNSGTDQQSL